MMGFFPELLLYWHCFFMVNHVTLSPVLILLSPPTPWANTARFCAFKCPLLFLRSCFLQFFLITKVPSSSQLLARKLLSLSSLAQQMLSQLPNQATTETRTDGSVCVLQVAIKKVLYCNTTNSSIQSIHIHLLWPYQMHCAQDHSSTTCFANSKLLHLLLSPQSFRKYENVMSLLLLL